MPVIASHKISLPQELDQFVKDRISAGRYATSSEVVREGLRLLQLREREADEVLTLAKSQLRRGSQQADAGEFVSAESVPAKAKALIERHRSLKKSRRR